MRQQAGRRRRHVRRAAAGAYLCVIAALSHDTAILRGARFRIIRVPIVFDSVVSADLTV